MRISANGDSVSEMNSRMHPSEYWIPLIHRRGMNNQKPMPVAPTIEKQPDDGTIKRDPFYSNIGLVLFIHFLKNFPKDTDTRGSLKIRSSLFFNDETCKDQDEKN
jgi:hypothetical protein